MVEVAIENAAEAANRFLDRHVAPFAAREALAYEEGLCQEALNAAGAAPQGPVICRGFFRARKSADVPRVSGALEDPLRFRGRVVMFVPPQQPVSPTRG